MQAESAALTVIPAARRNFWMNVLDGATFAFGLSLVSRYTVLPFFVSTLNNDPRLLAIIPSLKEMGWLLPQIFTAPLVASLPRRKPFILTITVGERLPFLVLGLLLLLLPGLSSAALLTVCFVCYGIHSISAGSASTAWLDFIARVIPGNRWGTFFGLTNAVGGGLGVLGALVATWVLATYTFPQNVGLLCLLCFAAMVVSFVFLASTVETASVTNPRVPLGIYMRGLVPLLRRDPGFRAYLLSRGTIGLAFTGHSFITAASLARFTDAGALVGEYTAALLGSQAIAHLALGTLADRWGHKQVLELSTGIGVASLVLALLAPTSGWFVAVFVLVGISSAGYQLSGYTLAMAFSDETQRPTYIGLANTALAPVGTLGPLLIAQLAATAGYGALFAATSLIGVCGLVALHWWVPVLARRSATSHTP